jgi:hypothetical protein
MSYLLFKPRKQSKTKDMPESLDFFKPNLSLGNIEKSNEF